MPLNPVPNYPASLDSLPDPTSTTYTDDDGFELDLLLTKHNAILEALEARVGSAAAAASLQGYVLAGNAAGSGLWLPTSAVAGIGLSPVINAGFEVWQRGTSFAAVADATYTADRWRYGKVGAMVHTVSRGTSVPAVAALVPRSNYSLLVDCTTVDSSIAAGDYCIVEQRIEGYNWLALDQAATVWSFWHNHTKTGLYSVALVNSGSDRSCVQTYTQAVADTWELAFVQFPASPSAGTWNYTNGIGARLVFALAAGSTFHNNSAVWSSGLFYSHSAQVNACDNTANNFQLWGVHPAVGTVGLPYSAPPFTLNLLRSQRYLYKTFPYATTPAQNAGDTGALGYFIYVAGATTAAVGRGFPVSMRATPTMVYYSTGNATANWYNHSDGASSGAAASQSLGESGVTVQNPQVAGDGVGERIAVHFTADAEL